jgi:hypothetical protein
MNSGTDFSPNPQSSESRRGLRLCLRHNSGRIVARLKFAESCWEVDEYWLNSLSPISYPWIWAKVRATVKTGAIHFLGVDMGFSPPEQAEVCPTSQFERLFEKRAN